jgi:putative transposase
MYPTNVSRTHHPSAIQPLLPMAVPNSRPRSVSMIGVNAMMRADGHQVSTSTIQRALRRRGLLPPTGFRADRRSWARLRKRVFRDPPRQRNRVWQMDFSEFETARGGIWRICAVIDYATKYCLAATVTPTSRGQDALGCLRRAVVEAERVLDLDDSRS